MRALLAGIGIGVTSLIVPAYVETASAESGVVAVAYSEPGQQTADEFRSSKVVGLSVYNNAKDKVGTIDDLILSKNGGVVQAVISVGGFLGVGEKDVAVKFTDLSFNRSQNGDTTVTLNATKDDLKSAPAYNYYKAK